MGAAGALGAAGAAGSGESDASSAPGNGAPQFGHTVALTSSQTVWHDRQMRAPMVVDAGLKHMGSFPFPLESKPPS